MANRSLGTLTLDLVLKLGGYVAGWDKAARETDKRMRDIKSALGTLKGAFAGIAGVIGIGSLADSITQMFEYGDEIGKAAERAGIGADSFSELAFAARTADIDIATLSNSIKTMQVNLSQAGTGNKTVLATLKALGLELKDIQDLDADKQFELLAERIAGLRDPADRTRAAVEIFGKAGAALLPLFSEGAEGIRKAREQAQEFGLAMSNETVAALQKGDDAMKKLKATWDGWTASAAVGTVGVLEALDLIDKDKLGEMKDQLQAIQNQMRQVADPPEGGPFDAKLYQQLSEEAQILERQIKNLQDTYTRGGGSRRGRDQQETSPGFQAQDSEAFEKLAATLREQSALLTASTKEQEIAYKIQAGAIEGLKKGEEERLLILARQYDAAVLARDMEKMRADAAAEQIKRFQDLEKEINEAAEASAAKLPEFEGMDGIEEAQEDADAFFEIMARGVEVTNELRTPQEVYNDTLAEMQRLYDAGAISAETLAKAQKQAAKDMDEANKKAKEEWSVFKDQAARNTQDILADALINGFEDGARGVLSSFATMLQKLAAQALAAKIAEKIFGTGNSSGGGGFDWGSLFGGGGGGGGGSGLVAGDSWWSWIAKAGMSYFGGGRAIGGPVTGGVPYMVGELGPEMVVPRGSGTVIPNNKLIGAPEVNVPIQINNVKDPSEIPAFFSTEEGSRTFTNLMTDNASMVRNILQGG